MREPQLVGKSVVQKMSLWTIGTPVSGPRRRVPPVSGQPRVGRAGRLQRALGIDGEQRVQRAVQALDAREVVLGELDGGELARGERARLRRERQLVRGVAHSITRGTRK